MLKECIKPYKEEENVIFYKGEFYKIDSIEDEIVCMISEDGLGVKFEIEELKSYFDL